MIASVSQPESFGISTSISTRSGSSASSNPESLRAVLRHAHLVAGLAQHARVDSAYYAVVVYRQNSLSPYAHPVHGLSAEITFPADSDFV
jgi:hypothetical protein